MEYHAGTFVSLGLDVGCPDHLAPFFCLIGDELAEVGGCTAIRRGPRCETFLDFGFSKAGVDFCIQHVDDFRKGVLGRDQALPAADSSPARNPQWLEGLAALPERHGGHGQRTQLAGLNALDRSGRGAK